MSWETDITPATVLGRVRRSMQIILHKWRPYLEEDLDVPIAEITMDEVILSTVAAALQRIHDSAPNSQHSEALQWSVWQVAGSAALSTPPLFSLPRWVLLRGNDEGYFSHRPPVMLVALLAVRLRIRYKWRFSSITTVRALLRRMEIPNVPWAQVVVAVFDHFECSNWNSDDIVHLRQTESNLTNVTRRRELSFDESLWLLSTLSELRAESWREQREPFLIGICLEILSGRVQEWGHFHDFDIVLLEAVITLAAMSCSPGHANRLHIITSSREHPWLLRNVRNPALFANWFEDTPSEHHEQLISLLFLVIYVLILQGSYPLTVQYLTVITAKGDLPLYTSALTSIAPTIGYHCLSVISRMLVAPRTRDPIPMILYSTGYGERAFQEELLKNYDLQLEANENPDSNFVAIVFMLSKRVPAETIEELRNVILELKNPWLRLAAGVIARLGIPDGPGLPKGPFDDHRAHNMIAALSLLRYTQGTVTQYTEFVLLESFLESREISIFSIALEYYIKTTISYPDPPAPSYHLPATVSATFNFILPDHQLWTGWTILGIFVDGFETLSVEWRRSFAEGFFALSRRPLLRPRGDMGSMTRESELEKILTWEYFHEEEQEREWTDSGFSGLDWMAMAWSLHLSQQSGRMPAASRQEEAESQNLSGPAIDEEFVFRALCKLLDAALPYQLIPIAPKLREFVQWFDDT